MKNTNLYWDERLTTKQKNANDQAWYKKWADELDSQHFRLAYMYGYGHLSELKRMKVNYDLFNNIIDSQDFNYVCQPFSRELGELPAKMTNKDIVSGKIKALLGLENKRPFDWNIIATNVEATTRKEQEKTARIKQYVEMTIMAPIIEQIQMQYMEQIQGQELTAEQQQQIQQEIQQQIEANTPSEVIKYMEREHQDPAEILANQLMQYLIEKCDVKRKFNRAYKHGLISGKEIIYVGLLNGEPEVWNVNSMRFNCGKAPDTIFIEDAEYCSVEYRMTPSDIVKFFGDVLTPDEIDRIYQRYSTTGSVNWDYWMDSNTDFVAVDDTSSIRVLHCCWKALREIGFLLYMDENGEIQERLVDETYKIDPTIGDMEIRYEWVPEVYEAWKIDTDIYKNCRPIPGQYKDIDTMWNCKLPYYGVFYDNENAIPTSLVDRLKTYQYFYNIIWYRIELLIASDKGKKVLMNINNIPDSAGIDIEKWQYYFEATPYMWYDNNEEGKGYNDVNTVAKMIDLSLASDIQKYIELAEIIRQQAGRSVGVTDQVEGMMSGDAVTNNQQSLQQSYNILEPYFEMHSYTKRNVLQALIEMGKIAYASNPTKKCITYTMDDMTQHILTIDQELLDNSTYGVFVVNNTRADEIKTVLTQLAHAALQNQKVELSDVISVMKQESLLEAEETLKEAEYKRHKSDLELQQQQGEQQQQLQQMQNEENEKEFEREKELIILKAEEDRKTKIAVAALTGASFNPDIDANNNGRNDFMEMAKMELSHADKQQKLALERDKFSHQITTEERRLNQEDEKLRLEKQKIRQKDKD